MGSREMTVEARLCPRCSSPMVLRTAVRGTRAGERFWGCSRFPNCRAVLPLADPLPSKADPHERADGMLTSAEGEGKDPDERGWAVSVAGGSAQAEFERRRERNRARIRRQWPWALGCGVTLLIVFVGAVVQTLLQEAAITARPFRRRLRDRHAIAGAARQPPDPRGIRERPRLLRARGCIGPCAAPACAAAVSRVSRVARRHGVPSVARLPGGLGVESASLS